VLAKYSLLGVTVLGTMSNNIVNVPLHAIEDEFTRPTSEVVLTVTAFVLVLAVAMPLTGWIGDRVGRKRTLIASLLLMLGAQVAAAIAPTLPLLITARAFQGLACSAIPPLVMGMLVTLFPLHRFRMMAAWAAANGIGQAIGPPVGGLISELLGWRAIFGVMAVSSALVLLGVLGSVPSGHSRPTSLHVPGALFLTTGTGLLLVSVTAASQPGVPILVIAAAALAGIALLAGFVAVSRGNPRAMVPPRLIIETRFFRSCVAAFGQMFVLGTLLVAIPLYLTKTLGLGSAVVGLLFFALPLAMAIMAPIVGRVVERVGPRPVLRAGLGILIVGSLVTGVIAIDDDSPVRVAVICGLLMVMGVGVAMVQTPAAAGATRSPAGQTGAALGLFNMLRFAGSTTGTAWVALSFPRGEVLTVLAGCAVVAGVALAVSFLGPDPEPLELTPPASPG
jgi:MFS family permease